VPLLWCFFIVLVSGAFLAAFGLRHINTVFAIGGKDAMEPDQVHSGLWNKGHQFGDEIQGLENDMRGSIAIGSLELVADIARGFQ
jgi:hypothetical protein